MKDHTHKAITPLPFNTYWMANIFLSIVGLLSSFYLAISHFRIYTDINYRSFCAISRTINCDTVSQSAYSVFFGVPLGVWGAIGYVVIIVLLILAKDKLANKCRVWTVLLAIASLYSICSLVLAFISNYLIRSYCIICILTYVVNFLLVYFTWLTGKRFDQTNILEKLKADLYFLFKDRRKRVLSYFMPIFLTVLLVMFFFPSYWIYPLSDLSKDLPTGLTEEGHPWIGAINPTHTIVEFADYQCFQCKKMHFSLRELVTKNPDKIRLVHRHFPMDRKFNALVKDKSHAGSGKMALLSIYAAEKNKFWAMNDLLFGISGNMTTINIKDIGEKVGLNTQEIAEALSNKRIYYHLIKDIKDGIALGIKGTPAYVINGRLYQAVIPPEIISDFLD